MHSEVWGFSVQGCSGCQIWGFRVQGIALEGCRVSASDSRKPPNDGA